MSRIWIPTLLAVGLLAPCALAEDDRSDRTDPDVIDDFADLDLEALLDEEVAMSVGRQRKEVARSAAAITVIPREQIANTHCSDVACLLRQVPEVQVRRIKPMYASIGARGVVDELGDKALVMVDGREINFEVFGVTFWGALPVHLEDIERIEIIRGPGSALYGANAHSLVVSIITRTVDRDLAEAFVGGGEHGRTSAHVRAGTTLGNWRLQMAGGGDAQDAWQARDEAEREVFRLRLGAERRAGDEVTSLQCGWAKAEGLLEADFMPYRVDEDVRLYALAAHRNTWLRTHLWFNLYRMDVMADLPLVYGGIEVGRFPQRIPITTSSLDGEIQLSWSPFEGNELIGGLNYRWITMLSEHNLTEEIHQHRGGVFLQDEQELWERLTLTAGARVDLRVTHGSDPDTPYDPVMKLTFSPRLAAVLRLAERHRLRADFSQAFRKPSFINTSVHFSRVEGTPAFPELGDFFRRNIGNENLDNERITSLQAGYRGGFAGGSLKLEATVYYNMYRDRIHFYNQVALNEHGLPDLDRSVVRYENGAKPVDTVGTSFVLTWRPVDWLRLHANYLFRYSFGTTDKEWIEWEPRHIANATVHFQGDRGLRLGAAAHFKSGWDETMKEHGSIFDPSIRLHHPPRVSFSAHASLRFGTGQRWMELGLRAANLFHMPFRDRVQVVRQDGTMIGGERMGRLVMLFVRGGL